MKQASVKKFIFVSFFLLFTICYPLFTSSADEVRSKAALVMDASTGRVLYAKNPNLKLPPASTTKLVTAMVVLDRADLKDTVTISEKAARVPSLKGTKLKAGETMTVEMLLYAALLRSANDAAFALAEAVAGTEAKFVGLMNKKALAIGASNTRFINTTGLPGKGQWITAHDLAKILRHALKYPVIKEIIGTKTAEIITEEGRKISLENTNRLLWSDNGVIGGKTGYTKAARHCFVCAEEKGDNTLIVAILGAPNRSTIWNEAEMLAAKGFRIAANNEQPVVYFTKADYKSPKAAKYSKNKSKAIRVSAKKEPNETAKKKPAKSSLNEGVKTGYSKISWRQGFESKG